MRNIVRGHLWEAPAILRQTVRGIPVTFAAIVPAYTLAWLLQRQVTISASSRGVTPAWAPWQATLLQPWPLLRVAVFAVSVAAIALCALSAHTLHSSWPGHRIVTPARTAAIVGVASLYSVAYELTTNLTLITGYRPTTATLTAARVALLWALVLSIAHLAGSTQVRHSLADLTLLLRLSPLTVAVTMGAVSVATLGVNLASWRTLEAALPWLQTTLHPRLIDELYMGVGPIVLQIAGQALYYSAAVALQRSNTP